MRIGMFIACSTLLACLVACSGSPEAPLAGEHADEVVTRGDEPMTISSGDGAQLPANFPDDVYLPGDYTIESVLDSDGFSMVAVHTDGEVDALAEEASRQMLDGGWKENMAAGDERSRIMTFQNARTIAALSFDRHDDGGVLYSVQLSPAAN